MKVLKPTLLSKNSFLAGLYDGTDDYPQYNIATPYAVGDKVYIKTAKKQYQCLIANTGESPTALASTYWVSIGTAQFWRPFDGNLTSASLGRSVVGSTPSPGLWGGSVSSDIGYATWVMWGLGRFSAVAVLETDAASVQVRFYNESGVLTYDQTIYSVDQTGIIDGWTYCFNEQRIRRDFVFDDIDGWGTSEDSQLYVSIRNSDTTVPISIGEIIVGEAHDIGACHADASIQLIDYSKKEIDPYGTVTIVQRAYSLNGSFEVEVEKLDRNRVQNLMASLRATPCVYYPTASDANQGIVLYGYVKDYNTTYQTPERAYASLEVEGMI